MRGFANKGSSDLWIQGEDYGSVFNFENILKLGPYIQLLKSMHKDVDNIEFKKFREQNLHTWFVPSESYL